MPFALDLVAGLLDLLGAFLFLGSAVGLVRLPDFYTRLHAPTKVASLGLLLFALASVLRYAGRENAGVLIREFLLIGMIFVTVPISAQMLIRAAVANGVPQTPETRGEASVEPLE